MSPRSGFRCCPRPRTPSGTRERQADAEDIEGEAGHHLVPLAVTVISAISTAREAPPMPAATNSRQQASGLVGDVETGEGAHRHRPFQAEFRIPLLSHTSSPRAVSRRGVAIRNVASRIPKMTAR